MQTHSFEPKEASASLIPHQYLNIDYSRLNYLGCQFGVQHLRQIAELGVITPKALQHCIYALGHAIENKWTPPGFPRRTHLQAFMDAIYTFRVFEKPEYLWYLRNPDEEARQFLEHFELSNHFTHPTTLKNIESKISNEKHSVVKKHNKNFIRSEFDDFSEMQKEILIFLTKNIDSVSRTTERISSGEIAQALNRTQASIKSALKRLEKMGAVERAQWKNGVQGWTRYRLPENTAKLLGNNERRMS